MHILGYSDAQAENISPSSPCPALWCDGLNRRSGGSLEADAFPQWVQYLYGPITTVAPLLQGCGIISHNETFIYTLLSYA